MRRRAVTTEATRAARTEARLRELDRSFNRVVGRQGDGGDGGGPAGPPGDDGAPGVSVTSATVNGSGHLILTLSTGATIDAGVVAGATGATGPTGPTGPADTKAPTDLGQYRRVQRTLQNLTGSTNTALTWTNDTATTVHASAPTSSTIRTATAGLWRISAGALLNGVAFTSLVFWVGSPDFVTARYASQGGWGAPASTFPSINVSTEVFLAANTDIIAGIWANASGAATAPAYDAIHLSATLMRR